MLIASWQSIVPDSPMKAAAVSRSMSSLPI
jgi:hypothetical protein